MKFHGKFAEGGLADLRGLFHTRRDSEKMVSEPFGFCCDVCRIREKILRFLSICSIHRLDRGDREAVHAQYMDRWYKVYFCIIDRISRRISKFQHLVGYSEFHSCWNCENGMVYSRFGIHKKISKC